MRNSYGNSKRKEVHIVIREKQTYSNYEKKKINVVKTREDKDF